MNNRAKKNKLIFSILLLFISSEARNKVLAEGKVLILSASFVFAKIETNFPIIAGQKPGAETTFPEYVKYLFNLSIFVGTLIVLGVLVWSGFRYITSRYNPVVIADIKKKIYSAFLGLLILLSAYVILRTINPNLVILSLPPLSKTPPGSEFQPPEIKPETATFQEIPLGTIIEDILAGNVSTTTDSDLRCYEYDSEGNTIDKNKDEKIDEKDSLNYNTFYCVKLLNNAFQIKINKVLYKVNNELSPLFNGCSCNSCKTYPVAYYSQGCETKWSYPGSSCQKCCFPTTHCVPHCSCCGSPRGKSKGCPGTDPCSNRKEIDKKRQEIKQIIDGGKLINGTSTNSAYNPQLDPKNNPKILTLEEAKKRMDAFYQDFINDLTNLKEAEKNMKSPYGERLTMAEFFDLKVKSQKAIEKTNFKNYNSSDYCREFNCTATNTQGICIACGLNKENRMCKLKDKTEYYVKSGDGATFYFNEEYKSYKEESILPGEKCVIEPKEEKGIQVGLIPIGEVVDETEKFAEKFAALYGLLTDSYQKAIDSAWNLYNSPENCNCGNCRNESNCSCSCPPCGPAGEGCSPPTNCSCSGCSTCEPNQPNPLLMKEVSRNCCCSSEGCYDVIPVQEDSQYVCPIDATEQEMKNISNESPGNYYCCNTTTTADGALKAYIATTTSWRVVKATVTVTVKIIRIPRSRGKTPPNYEKHTYEKVIFPEILGYSQIIEMTIQRMDDLFNARNLEEGDMNKCTILDKLSISREKMEKCLTGFGVPLKTGAAKMRTFSCSRAWDSVRLGDLIILPNFPYPATNTCLNCYPFNSNDLTKEQKLACLTNVYDVKCASSTYNLLDNYYCCAGGGY